MKKFSAILFLFIISIQCLPVKELGKCLFDNSFVEEEVCKKGIDKKADPIKELFADCFNATVDIKEDRTCFNNATDDLLPSPARDVTTPPPNA